MKKVLTAHTQGSKLFLNPSGFNLGGKILVERSLAPFSLKTLKTNKSVESFSAPIVQLVRTNGSSKKGDS